MIDRVRLTPSAASDMPELANCTGKPCDAPYARKTDGVLEIVWSNGLVSWVRAADVEPVAKDAAP